MSFHQTLVVRRRWRLGGLSAALLPSAIALVLLATGEVAGAGQHRDGLPCWRSSGSFAYMATGAGVVAAVLSVALFDLYVHRSSSFAVNDIQHLLTLR